jgi:hypothetical protein
MWGSAGDGGDGGAHGAGRRRATRCQSHGMPDACTRSLLPAAVAITSKGTACKLRNGSASAQRCKVTTPLPAAQAVMGCA